ncbi:efflux RND transporter periplasmic adaptor subunit [Phyllobacterium myrsinacearum]|nr:efflux RND transporter periplasmic adaptor subunit [Phyllobacterium myrsinacearum]PWV91687.1 multidrug efflux system membrane fusion protein [Phyllobacterium myrsinacearum]RZV05758.1 multidrug efflux system membrane fusion protein [Phyllobacterium myrsinacearum]
MLFPIQMFSPLCRQGAKIVFAVVVAASLAACGRNTAAETAPNDAAPSATVSVMQINPAAVTIADELPGRVSAFRTAEIRPQVGGIIEKRMFEQGSEVVAGQPLFQINAAPFKADVDSADAALQRAEATLVRTEAQVERARSLIASKAISPQSYEDAVAQQAGAKADVAGARAALERRRLDYNFASVKAPIPGRIGQELVTEGALVSPTDAKPMATIQQIDQVYVDVRQPAAQLDVIRAAARSGELEDASKVPVVILAANGTPYPVTGRALFSDISVDPGTGNVMVRVLVDNRDRVLLPGMYVRTRLPRGNKPAALLVPQQAVVRDGSGRPQLQVINDAKQVQVRQVQLGDVVNGQYVITSGLKAGETIVVEGQDRIQEGVALKTVAYELPSATVQR